MSEPRTRQFRPPTRLGHLSPSPEEKRRQKKILTLAAWLAVAALITGIFVITNVSERTSLSQYGTSGVSPQNPQGTQRIADSGYAAYDLAYCKTRGKLIRVAASASFRAAICQEGGQIIYYGLNKKDEGNIRLPAVAEGERYSATNNGVTYRISPNNFSIARGSQTVADEPIKYWLAPGDQDLEKPGDLGISTPISYPACDGRGVVVLGTSYNPQAYESEVEALLRANPGAQYLRTDLSCDNFRGPSIDNSGGNYIYAVYQMIGRDQNQLCSTVKATGATAERLQNDVDPTEKIICP